MINEDVAPKKLSNSMKLTMEMKHITERNQNQNVPNIKNSNANMCSPLFKVWARLTV
jgi:hypothetical protein